MFHILDELFLKGGMYWDVLASTSRPSMEERDVLASESQYIPHLKKKLNKNLKHNGNHQYISPWL